MPLNRARTATGLPRPATLLITSNVSTVIGAKGRPLTPPGSYKDVGPTIFESQWVGT